MASHTISTLPRRWIASLPAAACALALGACATTAPPTAQLAVARAAVAQAESAGAPRYAPTDLFAAQHKLDQADTAMKDKRYLAAGQLSDEAAADADLAERKARAAKDTHAADELQRANALLAQELARRSSQP